MFFFWRGSTKLDPKPLGAHPTPTLWGAGLPRLLPTEKMMAPLINSRCYCQARGWMGDAKAGLSLVGGSTVLLFGRRRMTKGGVRALGGEDFLFLKAPRYVPEELG